MSRMLPWVIFAAHDTCLDRMLLRSLIATKPPKHWVMDQDWKQRLPGRRRRKGRARR